MCKLWLIVALSNWQATAVCLMIFLTFLKGCLWRLNQSQNKEEQQ
jgi:uncharacterized membrane protein YqjE